MTAQAGHVNAWFLGNGTTNRDEEMWPYLSRCGLTGGRVLLEVGFGVSDGQARPNVTLFLLPENPDIELSAISPAPCLSGCCHTSHHADNGRNL